jgi:hypothetical protein
MFGIEQKNQLEIRGAGIMANLKSFDIKKLRPFRKPDNRLPQTTPDEDEQIAQLDQNLRPDEQAYVRHYVGYADVLLNEAEAPPAQNSSESNVLEMPSREGEKHSDENPSGEDGDGAEAA